MTICKAFYVRRRNGGPSSRLIQTFLREGVFYYLLISIANLVCRYFSLVLPLLTQYIPILFFRSMAFSTSSEHQIRNLVFSSNPMLRPRQSMSAINIPLSVMLSPVLACRLVCHPDS